MLARDITPFSAYLRNTSPQAPQNSQTLQYINTNLAALSKKSALIKSDLPVNTFLQKH